MCIRDRSSGVKANLFVRTGVHEYAKIDPDKKPDKKIEPDKKIRQPRDGKPIIGLKRCILEALRTCGRAMNVEELFNEIKTKRCVWISNVHQIVYID